VSYNFLDIFPTFPSDDGWYAVIGNSMGRGGEGGTAPLFKNKSD